MPGQAKLCRRAALSQQRKDDPDDDRGKNREDGNGTILPVQESRRARKNRVRDFLHGRRAGVSA